MSRTASQICQLPHTRKVAEDMRSKIQVSMSVSGRQAWRRHQKPRWHCWCIHMSRNRRSENWRHVVRNAGFTCAGTVASHVPEYANVELTGAARLYAQCPATEGSGVERRVRHRGLWSMVHATKMRTRGLQVVRRRIGRTPEGVDQIYCGRRNQPGRPEPRRGLRREATWIELEVRRPRRI